MNNEYTIDINEKTLSDRSKVYSVMVGSEEFDCISQIAAEDFAEGFKELLERFTNMTGVVRQL